MQTDNANRAAWNEVVPDCARVIVQILADDNRGLVQVPAIHAGNGRLQVRNFPHGQLLRWRAFECVDEGLLLIAACWRMLTLRRRRLVTAADARHREPPRTYIYARL